MWCFHRVRWKIHTLKWNICLRELFCYLLGQAWVISEKELVEATKTISKNRESYRCSKIQCVNFFPGPLHLSMLTILESGGSIFFCKLQKEISKALLIHASLHSYINYNEAGRSMQGRTNDNQKLVQMKSKVSVLNFVPPVKLPCKFIYLALRNYTWSLWNDL